MSGEHQPSNQLLKPFLYTLPYCTTSVNGTLRAKPAELPVTLKLYVPLGVG